LLLFVVPVLNTTICDRVLLFVPLGAGAPLTFFPNCIIALRIYALYGRSTQLALAFSLYLVAHTGVGFWADFTPTVTRIDVFAALGYPELGNGPAMRFCVPQLSTKLTGLQSCAYQIMQSIYDTASLALILLKMRKYSRSGLVKLIAKQGLAYYVLNVATYVTWTLMLLFAPVGSKYIIGGPALGLVCISVNRLTLHLRTYAVDSLPHDAGRTTNSRRRRRSWLGASSLDVDDTIMSSDGGRDTLEMHGLSSDDGIYPKIYDLNGNALRY